MNDYWKQQAGLTPDEKQAFVDKARADEARFLRSLRKVTDQADARMRTRTAKEQHADALAALNRERDEPVPDADDSSIQRGMLK